MVSKCNLCNLCKSNSVDDVAREIYFGLRNGRDDGEYIDVGLVETSKIIATYNVFFFVLETFDRV